VTVQSQLSEGEIMHTGIRVGRVAGIDIRIDWSWFLIVVLVTWNLSAVFGGIHPAWAPTLRWGIGLTAALLLFLSVLAHELAHSLLAQSRGLQADHGITAPI
jgi:Zn-dependent protease